jgi:KaiC/GvpD/RAD55 family RecA-like ATPase
MLNNLTNGVTDSNGVFFVGAYSGTGKTTFTLVNLVMGLIESGAKCLIVSNEQQSKYYKLILISFICQNVSIIDLKLMNCN